MPADALRIEHQPRLSDGRMVLAFSGWMDGGQVSTGTVDWLVNAFSAPRVGGIDPEGFYIYNFPGSMEVTALFRPNTQIAGGLVAAYQPPGNDFYCDPRIDLVLFHGREPNIRWNAFADCLFELAEKSNVTGLYFVGSYGGAVPHTREPRLYTAVSDPSLLPAFEQVGVRPAHYEGPAGFSTHMLTRARESGMPMSTLVAEIPVYIQGPNPRCIEAVVRKLAAILGLQIDLDDLRAAADDWERRLNEVLNSKEELASYIRKLEADYDNEVFDTQMGDLKDWLQQQGIRVD